MSKLIDEEKDHIDNVATAGRPVRRLTKLLPALLCLAGLLGAQDTPKPDNTKINQRDRMAGEATSDQQKANAADQKMTQEIRRSLMADKSLSTYAHNIKIITQHGMVTLKGPVRTDAEKQTVMASAVAVAGSADKVKDQISVTPTSKRERK